MKPVLTPEGRPSITDWALSPQVLHLNHGSFGAVPRVVVEAQAVLRDEMESNPCGWFTTLTPRVGEARARIADYLGSAPEETAIVPNASSGLTVVFNAVPAWTGMKIVTTDHTYGAVLMGAERLARRWDGSVEIVRIPLSANEDEAFALIAEAMDDNTALVVIDHVTSATAKILPAARVAAEGRRRGIPVVIDAAHAPGVFAEPLAGMDADFWVGNLHKFSCAPRGTAALVARSEHAQKLYPIIDSWGAPHPFPARFDQQGTIDVTTYLAAPLAFSTIEERYGWGAVREYSAALADYAEAQVSAAFTAATGEDATVDVGTPVGPLRLVRLPAGLATTPDDAHSLRHAIATHIGAETAITSWNGQGFLRLSAHVYNTARDYDEFAERAVPFIVEQA